MSIHRAYIKLSVVLALTSVALFTTSAFGQSPATGPNSTDKGIAAAQGLSWETRKIKLLLRNPNRDDEEQSRG